MEHHEPSERDRSPGTELTFSVLFAVVGVTLVVLCGQPELDERLDTFLLLIIGATKYQIIPHNCSCLSARYIKFVSTCMAGKRTSQTASSFDEPLFG